MFCYMRIIKPRRRKQDEEASLPVICLISFSNTLIAVSAFCSLMGSTRSVLVEQITLRRTELEQRNDVGLQNITQQICQMPCMHLFRILQLVLLMAAGLVLQWRRASCFSVAVPRALASSGKHQDFPIAVNFESIVVCEECISDQFWEGFFKGRVSFLYPVQKKIAETSLPAHSKILLW